MKINFSLSETEVKELLQPVLQNGIGFNNGIVGEINIEKDYSYTSLNNPDMARANKIALIKLVRQVATDIDLGRVELCNPTNCQYKTIPLAIAKEYVEKYFKM